MVWEETAPVSKISSLMMEAVGFSETRVPVYCIRLHGARSIEDRMLLLTATRTSNLPSFLHFYKNVVYTHVLKNIAQGFIISLLTTEGKYSVYCTFGFIACSSTLKAITFS